MTCTEYKRWLSSYLDGVLDAAQQERLEAHLSACDGCRVELIRAHKLLVSLRSLGQVEAPNDLLAGIHAKLFPHPRWKRLFAWWPAALPRHSVAVALTAILVVFAVAIPLSLKPATRSQEKPAAKSVLTDRKLRRLDEAVAPEAQERHAERKDVASESDAIAMARRTQSDQFASAPGPSLVVTKQEEIPAGDERTRLSAGVAARTAAPSLDSGESARDESIDREFTQAPLPQAARSASALEGSKAAEPPQPASAPEAPAVVEQPPIQLQWSVANRVDATAQLAAWVAQIRGATLSAAGDHLVVQLPESRYPLLFAELAKHGTPSRLIHEGAKDKEQLKEEANERRSLTAGSKKPASVAPAKEPLMTVELLLVPSAE